MKLVIIGGHHSSALPVIKKLKQEHKDVKVHWIGHKYSQKGNTKPTLEYIEITELKIPFYNLVAGKFYKTYDPIRLLKIPVGFVHALYLLLKIRPNVILSFGGYLAVPVVLVGKFLGIKTITHEQTVVVGYANKLISKYVDKVLISWPESKKYFKGNDITVTGLPLREEIFEYEEDTLTINDKLPTIYVTGGKTGSHNLNVLMLDIMDELVEFCNVIHQCGDSSTYDDIDLLEYKYKKFNERPGKYIIKRFVMKDEIGEVFGRSDLVVCRSGAHTISEIIALEKPSILIPIPWVSHNEQYKNAEMVKGLGLGEILEEENLTSIKLLNKIKDMLANLKGYKINDKSLKKELLKDSAEIIVNEVLSLYKA